MAKRRQRPDRKENTIRERSARPRTSAPGRSRRRDSAEDHSQLRFSMVLSSAIVVIMTIIVAARSYSLKQRLDDNLSRIDQLTQEIEAETERTQDIEEYRQYTLTKEFVEQTARDKLGLVYEDETIFKKQGSQ